MVVGASRGGEARRARGPSSAPQDARRTAAPVLDVFELSDLLALILRLA
eukprot:CAMPEP_0184091012 /NCGR_PEP_ID=MMETSP0974-20121125/7519_1 /TAXON_ID=483370 /ORGANISM="non described non described, Strain CCMP2097" /LENGTH=48 /DNA_ID= /DNA_START= /DNA_END= /DNA_ORIENTATION=